uniref:Teneurin-2 n=1 Tax=Steinernema glaseri TaxID=37863 RepID=A0A1I7YDP3_9BILA
MGNYKNRRDMLDEHGSPNRTSITVGYSEQNEALFFHGLGESDDYLPKEHARKSSRRRNYCIAALLIATLLIFLAVVYYYHYYQAPFYLYAPPTTSPSLSTNHSEAATRKATKPDKLSSGSSSLLVRHDQKMTLSLSTKIPPAVISFSAPPSQGGVTKFG